MKKPAVGRACQTNQVTDLGMSRRSETYDTFIGRVKVRALQILFVVQSTFLYLVVQMNGPERIAVFEATT